MDFSLLVFLQVSSAGYLTRVRPPPWENRAQTIPSWVDITKEHLVHLFKFFFQVHVKILSLYHILPYSQTFLTHTTRGQNKVTAEKFSFHIDQQDVVPLKTPLSVFKWKVAKNKHMYILIWHTALWEKEIITLLVG